MNWTQNLKVTIVGTFHCGTGSCYGNTKTKSVLLQLYTSRHMERTLFVFVSIIGNTDMGNTSRIMEKPFLFHKYLYILFLQKNMYFLCISLHPISWLLLCHVSFDRVNTSSLGNIEKDQKNSQQHHANMKFKIFKDIQQFSIRKQLSNSHLLIKSCMQNFSKPYSCLRLHNDQFKSRLKRKVTNWK